MLKEIYPNCAGLDVHKRFVTVCRLTVDAQGVTHFERRKFSTMTADLEALAAWLAVGRCTHVAMESTGVYPGLSVQDRLAADLQHSGRTL